MFSRKLVYRSPVSSDINLEIQPQLYPYILEKVNQIEVLRGIKGIISWSVH